MTGTWTPSESYRAGDVVQRRELRSRPDWLWRRRHRWWARWLLDAFGRPHIVLQEHVCTGSGIISGPIDRSEVQPWIPGNTAELGDLVWGCRVPRPPDIRGAAPRHMVFFCHRGGTCGEDEPDWASVSPGHFIPDGSVVWMRISVAMTPRYE